MSKNTSKNLTTLLNDKRKIRVFYKIPLFFLTLLLIALIPITTVQAASILKLTYDGKNVNYSGKQVSYILNKKQLNSKSYPGIIINGTSLASASDIFNKSEIKATYKNDKGNITLTKDNVTVKLKIGSKTAYINGAKKTLDIAPRYVKFRSTNTTKVMVPARFVAEAFGYTYNYNSSTATATLTSPLRLYYNGKWQIYTGTKGTIKVDNKKVITSGMPAIIQNNTALLNAYQTFENSSIKADYNYNGKTKEITITKDDTTIVMTHNSKTAYVNGKKYTMPTQALRIKNGTNNTSYSMVPGQFVATHLGYNYRWDSSAKMSVITTKPVMTEPEDIIKDTDYFTASSAESILNEINDIKNTTFTTESLGNSSGYISTILDIVKTNTNETNKETFNIQANASLGDIKSSYVTNNELIITLASTNGQHNKVYYFDNSIVSTITTEVDYTTNQTTLRIALKTKMPLYNITLNNNRTSLDLTLYTNYISNITANRSASTDIITLEGLYLPNADVTETSTQVIFDFPYTINALGELTQIIEDVYCVSEVSISATSSNTTRLTINKTENSEYFVSQSGNSYIITLFDDTLTDFALKALIPDGVSKEEIVDVDLYATNEFKITVPGNHLSFYEANPIACTSSMIESITTTLNTNGDTDIKVKTHRLQGYKITVKDDIFTIKVGNPSEIYKNIVVLDPGHGGKWAGTTRSGVLEKDLTLKMLYTLGQNYFNGPDSEIKAYYSRTGDTILNSNLSTDLRMRADLVKKYEADLFISLHINAIGNKPSVNGTEIYYSTDNNKTQKNGLNSKALATMFANNLPKAIGMNNRGVKTAGFVVVKYNTVPAILIELGYITSDSDFTKMKKQSFQDSSAAAIYDITKQVFETYPTGR